MGNTIGHGIILAHNNDLGREEWLANRQRGIGGSDLAGIAGVSQYKTPLGIFLDKTEPYVEQRSEAADWGHRLEPFVADQVETEIGQAINEPRVLVQHPEHEFMLANIDRVTTDALVEIKTRRTDRKWKDADGLDIVPVDTELQVRHYLACTGFDVGIVGTLFFGQELRLYRVERDLEIEQGIIELEADFWQRVLDKAPPAAQGGDGPNLGRMYAEATDDAVEASETLLALARERKDIDAMMKPLKAKRDEIDAMLKEAIGSSTQLVWQGHKLASWSKPKPTTSVNIEALTEAHPALVAEFTEETTTSRRLTMARHLPLDDDAF